MSATTLTRQTVHWAPFTTTFILPLLLAVGIMKGGLWAWAPMIWAFVLIPTLDEITGDDTTERDEHTPYANAYEWILLAWVPVEICVLAAAFWSVGHVEWSTFEWIGLVLSMGTSVGGGGITVAHELMHRRDKRSRAAAEFLMTCASYPHFCVEHILGHHKNIGTHEDPATARYGESLYMFWPRTLIGTVRSAWELETTRVQRRKIPWWSLKNRRLRHPLNVVALYTVAWLLGGLPAVGFAIAQSIVAVLLLETVNYLEHYGLERERTEEGGYVRVAPTTAGTATTGSPVGRCSTSTATATTTQGRTGRIPTCAPTPTPRASRQATRR